MAPNLTDIARDFNFTNTQCDTILGREISFSLFLVGAPASLIVGYHSDRVNRKNLYNAVVFSGAVGCLLTYFVEEYWQLFVLRALTGIASASASSLPQWWAHKSDDGYSVYLLYLYKRTNTEVLLNRRSPSTSFQCLAYSSHLRNVLSERATVSSA